MADANLAGGKLLGLSFVQHAAVGKPHIVRVPAHIPAVSTKPFERRQRNARRWLLVRPVPSVTLVSSSGHIGGHILSSDMQGTDATATSQDSSELTGRLNGILDVLARPAAIGLEAEIDVLLHAAVRHLSQLTPRLADRTCILAVYQLLVSSCI